MGECAKGGMRDTKTKGETRVARSYSLPLALAHDQWRIRANAMLEARRLLWHVPLRR